MSSKAKTEQVLFWWLINPQSPKQYPSLFWNNSSIYISVDSSSFIFSLFFGKKVVRLFLFSLLFVLLFVLLFLSSVDFILLNLFFFNISLKFINKLLTNDDFSDSLLFFDFKNLKFKFLNFNLLNLFIFFSFLKEIFPLIIP